MSPESHLQGAEPAADRPAVSGDAGTLAMGLFLASLGMLFAASLVAYAVIRSRHQPWPPPGFPALPGSLWLSTLVILSASFTVQRAWLAARRGSDAVLRRNLLGTLLLGLLFLGLQAWAWWGIWSQMTGSQQAGPYIKLFYTLTGLHAAHVLGGLGPLAFVFRRARAGVYRPGEHAGVRYCALYWHFLGAVWCVLFVAVYLV